MFDNDIAFVKLNEPIEYTNSTSPLCLVPFYSGEEVDRGMCKITGYGLTSVRDGMYTSLAPWTLAM